MDDADFGEHSDGSHRVVGVKLKEVPQVVGALVSVAHLRRQRAAPCQGRHERLRPLIVPPGNRLLAIQPWLPYPLADIHRVDKPGARLGVRGGMNGEHQTCQDAMAICLVEWVVF